MPRSDAYGRDTAPVTVNDSGFPFGTAAEKNAEIAPSPRTDVPETHTGFRTSCVNRMRASPCWNGLRGRGGCSPSEIPRPLFQAIMSKLTGRQETVGVSGRGQAEGWLRKETA